MDKKAGNNSFSARDLIRRFTNYGGIDIWFLVIVLVLLCIGLVMMFSASYPYALTMYGKSTYFIGKQAFFAVIGVVAMLFFSGIKTELWKKLTFLICLGSTFLLLIVFVLPQYRAGFYRWINLGFTTFQPSELAKFAVIVAGAYLYSKYNKKMSSTRPVKTGLGAKVNRKIGAGIVRESWVPTWMFCAFFGMSAILVFLENHLSGCILIFSIGVAMMFIGGVRARWFVAGVVAVLCVALIVCVPIYSAIQEKNEKLESGEISVSEADEYVEEHASSGILKGYMVERIVGWLDKGYDPQGVRWQTNQALYAIGSGGFFGRGIGNSTQKYMYVSEPQNDMIFSIVCEELGFVGAALIIILFALLVYRGIVIGLNAKTRYGAFLAMGLVLQVGLQVMLNIGVASDSIPNTGISLPFFSYGGTSLVVLLSEMGIVLAVSRESRVNKK